MLRKVKGYSQFESVKDSVNAYVVNLNTHPAYSSFRKSRAQLRKADQELTASTMIHKLKGYSTRGQSYNNYLFAMFQTISVLSPHICNPKKRLPMEGVFFSTAAPHCNAPDTPLAWCHTLS